MPLRLRVYFYRYIGGRRRLFTGNEREPRRALANRKERCVDCQCRDSRIRRRGYCARGKAWRLCSDRGPGRRSHGRRFRFTSGPAYSWQVRLLPDRHFQISGRQLHNLDPELWHSTGTICACRSSVADGQKNNLVSRTRSAKTANSGSRVPRVAGRAALVVRARKAAFL